MRCKSLLLGGAMALTLAGTAFAQGSAGADQSQNSQPAAQPSDRILPAFRYLWNGQFGVVQASETPYAASRAASCDAHRIDAFVDLR